MKVILDTNIFFVDFNMKSPAFAILLASAKKGDIELYIPEIVVDEVVNKFRQNLEKTQQHISSEISAFNKFTNEEIVTPISKEQVGAALIAYRERFDTIIAENKAQIIPYPTTPHKYLAKKAMLAKKPFNSNEKGYRDSLIWENIKSFVSGEDIEIASVPELVFITTNHTDFVSNGSDLHQDLVDELEQEDLKTDSVVIYQNLNDFNEAVTKLHLEQASTLEGKLKNDEFWDFQLKEIIDKYLYKELDGNPLTSYYDYVPAANDYPVITSINDDYKLEKISVKKLSADEYIVDVEFNLEMEVDFYVDKSTYFSEEHSDYYVVDHDWNDHVVYASKEITFPISMTLIINSKLECDSIQINNMGDDHDDF